MVYKKKFRRGHWVEAMRLLCIVGLAICWGCMTVDASEIPECFRVLGTTVPADKQNPPTHGFTEKMPETHMDAYEASADETVRGYVVYAKSYLSEVYPRTTPQPSQVTASLSGFSSRGEIEPVTFSIYALEDLSDVSVSVSDLKGPGESTIGTHNLDVRAVRSWPKRVWKNPPVSEYLMTPWFLEKLDTYTIPQASSRRFWINLRVPPMAKAGTYHGVISVEIGNRSGYELTLTFEVLDIELMDAPVKQSIIYHMHDDLNKEMFLPFPWKGHYRRVAVNLKAHGFNAVFIMLPVAFQGRMQDGKAVFDLESLAPFVDECNALGIDVIFNMTLDWVLPGTGPSDDYGVNIRGFVDSWQARGWKLPILSYGDESDASDRWKHYIRHLEISKKAVPEAKTYTTIVYPWNTNIFEPHLDIRAHALLDDRVIGPTKKADRELWQYSGSHGGAQIARFYRGIWGYRYGLKGLSDWVYFMLYHKDEFLDDLVGGASAGGPNHRCFVVPTERGPLPSPRLEGIREGAKDRQYLYTLDELIKAARASGAAELAVLADAAQHHIDSHLEPLRKLPRYEKDGEFPHRIVSGRITDPAYFNRLRQGCATHIRKLQQALK